MSAARNGSRSSVLIYAVLGLGLVLVVGGAAYETLPDLRPARLEPVPAPDPWEEPARLEPLPPPEPSRPFDGEPGPALFWHATWPSEPPTACVLAVETTSPVLQMRRMTLACADGRRLEGDLVSTAPIGGSVGPSGASVYRAALGAVIVAADGARFGIDVETATHRLDVTEADTGRMTMLFVEDLSVPLPGAGVGSPLEVGWVASRLAVPTFVTGSIPVGVALVRGTGREPRPGDPVCELRAGPVLASNHNCRIALRCNGEVIYGAESSGYNSCEQRDGRILRASDRNASVDDTDPRLELDLQAGTLTVSDATETVQWSASFELLPDPRCALASFRGRAAPDALDQPWEDWQLAAGTTPSMTSEDGMTALDSLAMRCLDAEAIARRGDETTTLQFGAGSASLAGYTSRGEATPAGFYAFRVVE